MSDKSNKDKKNLYFSLSLESMEDWLTLFDKNEKISRNLIDHYVQEKDNKLITDTVFPTVCEFYTACKQGKIVVDLITEEEDRDIRTSGQKEGHVMVRVEEMQLLQSCISVILLHKQSLNNMHDISMEIH